MPIDLEHDDWLEDRSDRRALVIFAIVLFGLLAPVLVALGWRGWRLPIVVPPQASMVQLHNGEWTATNVGAIFAATLDFWHFLAFWLGALASFVMRPPASWLGWTGFGQALYMLVQSAGYDPLWWPLTHVLYLPDAVPLGTLGTKNMAAAWVAVTAPLLVHQPWAVAVMALTLGWTRSLGALVALAVALLVVMKGRRRLVLAAAALLLFAAPLLAAREHGLAAFQRGTFLERLALWDLGLRDWLRTWPSLLFGYGMTAWPLRLKSPVALNEYLQVAHATGLVGLAVLGGVLAAGRRMFQHPVWGGSAVALAVVSMSASPFHHPMLALLGLIVVGAALTKETHGNDAR